MNILVVGAHFYNKGAHLMMKTVLEEFYGREKYNLYLSPCSGTKEQIKGLGYGIIDFPLKHVTAYRSFNIFFYLGYFIKYLKKEYQGNLPISKIDAVLDISGFAFSDQWGDEAVVNVQKLISRLKKKKKKYIFLPQAFGPFTSQRIKKNMISVIKKADLIMARDDDSYNMLKELDDSPKILKYPDITINLKVEKTKFEYSDYICVVPNERMLDQGKEYWPEGKYLEYIKNSIDRIYTQTNHQILILVHDKGSGDMKLAEVIVDNYRNDDRVSLFYEEDPVRLKSIIGQAKFIVGSRYHALVSALSQNVPCISLGWSHKYKMLFQEYNAIDYVFEVPDEKSFKHKIEEICSAEKREELKQVLRDSNTKLMERNEEMWSLVYKTLNQ